MCRRRSRLLPVLDGQAVDLPVSIGRIPPATLQPPPYGLLVRPAEQHQSRHTPSGGRVQEGPAPPLLAEVGIHQHSSSVREHGLRPQQTLGVSPLVPLRAVQLAAYLRRGGFVSRAAGQLLAHLVGADDAEAGMFRQCTGQR